jgi:hypothetical protein
VSFSRRGEFLNPQFPVVIRQFDDGFSRLFGYTNKAQAELDRPLTLVKLLSRLEGFINKDRWNEFAEEQKLLTDSVIRAYGFARAKVPIVFNENHPHREYRETSYLPSIVAEVVDGNLDGPHKKYLLVIYIELQGNYS